MNGISTDNFKSIKELALNVYNKTPVMAPSKEFIHSAVKYYLLGSIPVVLGQDPQYGITEKGVILASVFGSIGLLGAAVGIVGAVYCCLKRNSQPESGLLLPEDVERGFGGAVIRSINEDQAPRIREIFGESSESAHLQAQPDRSSYDSTAILSISTQEVPESKKIVGSFG